MDHRTNGGYLYYQWILVPMDPSTNGYWEFKYLDTVKSHYGDALQFKTGGCSQQLIGEYNFWRVYLCCSSVSVLAIYMEKKIVILLLLLFFLCLVTLVCVAMLSVSQSAPVPIDWLESWPPVTKERIVIENSGEFAANNQALQKWQQQK